jgi:hypothetical protein
MRPRLRANDVGSLCDSTRGAFHSPASDASNCAAHKEPFPCAECRRVWAREDLAFRVCIAAVAVGALVCFGRIRRDARLAGEADVNGAVRRMKLDRNDTHQALAPSDAPLSTQTYRGIDRAESAPTLSGRQEAALRESLAQSDARLTKAWNRFWYGPK